MCKIWLSSDFTILAEVNARKNYWLPLYDLSDKLPNLFRLQNEVFNDTNAIAGSPRGKKISKFHPL
jgi:hypothetical protein